jgi:hypothetical protein
MIFRRPGALGLLVLVGALSACSSSAAPVVTEPGVAALPSYVAPARAPGFCELLARSTHLTALPAALGRLSVDPADADARQEVAGAVTDLRPVLDDVRYAVEYADLETAVENLVTTLTEVSGGRLRDDVGERVGSALTTLGELAQPACEFPT